MLSAGRARIVEAKIDAALGVVQRLDEDDLDWLRANAVTFASDLTRFAAEMQSLASAIGPQLEAEGDAR